MIALLAVASSSFQLLAPGTVAAPASLSHGAVARSHGVMAKLGVKHFISDLEFLGPCRFVVAGSGAILEGVGVFENLREGKPGLATVSNDDNSFECHIRLQQVCGAQFAKKDTADGRTLHIVRLLGDEKKSVLSAILHPEADGEVDESAIQFWGSLRERFGEDVELVPDEEEDKE